EAAALRSAGRRETGAARRFGHHPRPVGHGPGPRRRGALGRRIGEAGGARPGFVAGGARQPAPRPAGGRHEEPRLHRPELRRPRGRDGGAHPEGADRVPEVARRAQRPERRRGDPQEQSESRLGSGAGHHHRRPRHLRLRRQGDGPRGRLRGRQRRVRARVADRARRLLGQGQGLRHLRPRRPLAGDARRGAGPAGPLDVLRRGRGADAGRQHAHHDLRRPHDRQLRVALHHLAPGRRDLHRHAAGRGPRQEADPDLPQARPDHAARHRRARGADAAHRGLRGL
ncbi:MAG: 2,4-diketo-3-deoxy-L-fuconate hydrolase, partial [uncultured Acetobacteraceae bacterium]